MEILINKYLPVKILEKKQFGEVFTPVNLINEMLDTLPCEIFQNPNLKWLDPTAGIGNFMIILYFRLMEGLSFWEPNYEKRQNHILDNMLFMIEINNTNVEICKNIFINKNSNKKSNKTNIICEDFLSSNNFNTYFDVIIGNPPFQDKARVGGKNKLYEKIIVKCLNILHVNGKLLFLVPDNLFSGNSSKTYLKLLNYPIHFINFRQNITDTFIGIQQKICYFLLEKKDLIINFSTTIYSDSNNKLDLQLMNRPINPIRNWNIETEKWMNQYVSLTKNANVFYNRGKSIHLYNENKTNNKYTLIYTPLKNLYTGNLELAIGFGIKKIILFIISTKGEFTIDWKGEYGVGPNTIYISFEKEEEGHKLDIFFKSDIYKQLLAACKTCRQFLKIGLIQYLNFEKIIYI